MIDSLTEVSTRRPGRVHVLARGPMMTPMGLKRRPEGTAVVQLNTRVLPIVRDAVTDAAAASGMSVSLYIETHFTHLMTEDGRLPRAQDLRSELPITAA